MSSLLLIYTVNDRSALSETAVRPKVRADQDTFSPSPHHALQLQKVGLGARFGRGRTVPDGCMNDGPGISSSWNLWGIH